MHLSQRKEAEGDDRRPPRKATANLISNDRYLITTAPRCRQRRPIRAFSPPRLKQEQHTGLYREFEVLSVDEQGLQLVADVVQPCPGGQQTKAQAFIVARLLAPSHHIHALRVELEVEIQLPRAGGGIAGEGLADARFSLGISVDHGQHCHPLCPRRH